MLAIRSRTELTLRSLAAIATNRCYCKDYSSDEEKDTKKKSKKIKQLKDDKVAADAASPLEQPESAATRLNRLLASMQTDDNSTFSAVQHFDMARPGEGNKKRREEAKQKAAAKDIFVAAKRVASLLNEENQKQIESELLAKLLGHDQPETAEGSKEKDTDKGQEIELSLSELIVGMKIDRSQQPTEQSRGDFVRRSIAARRPQQQQQNLQDRDARDMPRHKRQAETYTGSVNLFGSQPLGIFKADATLNDSSDILSTWAQLQQRELKLQVSHPPANYFEKLVTWTEQGKVWRFPIDNEQDWDEEVDVDFSEHIFLEQHLEPWCPNKGPVRHFMELVCVGLSKNPYITAKDKKEHILWYRDYFEAKKDILRDLMSKEKMEEVSKSSKSLEA